LKSAATESEDEMQEANVKDEARRLVNDLPESATWEDLMYRIYVRQAIESGLEDSQAGRLIEDDEVCRRFGLSQ
jgi:predicted transcriptional regulator